MAAGDAAVVAVEQVSKTFSTRPGTRSAEQPVDIRVVDDVSFAAGKGELVSLLGPSGCGKTTLLRMAAGLLSVEQGRISIAGVPVSGPRRDCCMVFQNFGLLPWRTVLDNVTFALELDRMAKAERLDVARHYIELVGLSGFERHYPHELSGGMQQRVGIARGLTRHPSVLLMDEPFGALDAQTREQLQDDFIRVRETLKTTILFVTHSIDEALIMSDRILVFTARPARIKTVLESPLGGERGNAARAKSGFATLGREIRQLLKTEISAHG